MKRLSSLALWLLLALAAPRPGLCAEQTPDDAAEVALPADTTATDEAAPAAVIAASATEEEVAPFATGSSTEPGATPFRERPYRAWPFYYHRSFSPAHERTIYGPLWLTERDRNENLFYPLWPFAGTTRTPEGDLTKLDLIWPFTGYQRKGDNEAFNLLWPVTGYSHTATPIREDTSLFLVRPLLGYYRETDRDRRSGRVTGEEVGYLPLYYGSRTDNSSFRYVFPSFLSGSRRAGTSWHTLLPLYTYAKTPDSSFLFALPSYLRLNGPERDIHSFIPFYHIDESPTRSTVYVFPDYFRTASDDGDSLGGLLPFYLNGSGSDGSSFRFVFPNWYERHRKGYDATLFPPFYAASDDETGEVGVHRRSVLGPLYLSEWRDDGTSFRFVFPNWYERHSDGYDATLFPPFYAASDDETGEVGVHRRSVLGPLYLDEQRDDGSRRTSVLLNLYYRKVDTATDERFTTFLWPLVTYGESPAQREFRLWPYSYEETVADHYRAHYLLWPMIGFGSGDSESTARVLPLFYRRATPDRSLTLLAPLFLHTRTPESRFSLLAPVYASYASADRELTVLPPAVWGRNGERRYSLLPPIWYRESRGSDGKNLILNTWWAQEGDRSSFAFFPLYYRATSPTESQNLLLNTWWGHEGDRTTFAFAPLYYRSESPTDSQNLLLNTWWGHEGDRTTFAFAPLYYRSATPTDSRNLLLNTWWGHEGDRSSFAFAPLYYRSATPRESRNLLLNTWWSGGERMERFVFFPLAWYRSPTPAERDFTLFPLLNYSEKGPDSSTFSFLWRLYYQQREGDNSMAALLWWLYRTEARPGYKRMMCWPFIDYERNSGATDEVFTSFLLRFVTYERNGERLRVRLLGITLREK